jgi:hypothetical protein
LRISVGHSDRGRFLERKDIPERGGAQQSVHQRQLGRARITENILDTLAFQDFKKDFGSTSCIGALEGGDWTGRHRCSFSADIAASGVGGFYTRCFQFFFSQRNQPAKGARILKPVLHAIALFV